MKDGGEKGRALLRSTLRSELAEQTEPVLNRSKTHHGSWVKGKRAPKPIIRQKGGTKVRA